jgi:putative copper export protein
MLLLAVGMIMDNAQFHHWSLEFATSAVKSQLGQTLFYKSILFVQMT